MVLILYYLLISSLILYFKTMNFYYKCLINKLIFYLTTVISKSFIVTLDGFPDVWYISNITRTGTIVIENV